MDSVVTIVLDDEPPAKRSCPSVRFSRRVLHNSDKVLLRPRQLGPDTPMAVEIACPTCTGLNQPQARECACCGSKRARAEASAGAAGPVRALQPALDRGSKRRLMGEFVAFGLSTRSGRASNYLKAGDT
jgi:hypothetical protein